MVDVSMSETKRFFLAWAGGVLLSIACVTAALAPADAAQANASASRPILL